jgi:hypothetical protein
MCNNSAEEDLVIRMRHNDQKRAQRARIRAARQCMELTNSLRGAPETVPVLRDSSEGARHGTSSFTLPDGVMTYLRYCARGEKRKENQQYRDHMRPNGHDQLLVSISLGTQGRPLLDSRKFHRPRIRDRAFEVSHSSKHQSLAFQLVGIDDRHA